MLNIGVVGLGFAGMLHARAAASCGWSDAGPDVRLAAVADPRGDVTGAVTARNPDVMAFTNAADLIAQDGVDAVVIAVPNAQHASVAIPALEAGKPVLIEKPLAARWDDAAAIAAAARSSAATASVGYVFLNSPAVAWAIETMRSGAFGTPLQITLTHSEDYAASQGASHTEWRADPAQAGFGALGDLGAHALSLGLALCGPVARVAGLAGHTPGRAETTDDFVSGLMAFENGAHGTVIASRVAHGRKMHLGFHIHATGGSLVFDHERPNEIQVCRAGDAGFSTHLVGPEHPYYDRFLPAAGHGLGFGDLFTLQMQLWADHVVNGAPFAADIGFGMRVESLLHDIARASRDGAWITCGADRQGG